MSYTSILVHLDTSTHANARLELAAQLAHRFHAKLTGVFSAYVPDSHTLFIMAGTASYYAEHARQRQEQRDELKRLFHAELARLEVDGQWISAEGYPNEAMPPYSRLADLVVAGQTDLNDPESFVAEQFVENLIMAAGRPVLLMPSSGSFADCGKHVLIAWDGSREATRALHDAMPFLSNATNVTLLTINADRDEPAGHRIPGADIALTLARHGVKVEVREVNADRYAPVGEVLLSQAADRGCDLVVMGAYAHTRLRELVMGGATRTLLRSMTVPVLFSH
ncbi:universal stress protein A (plasmid) [Paraburkholderia sp. PGU19]|uniref:universal stress protein n=1 Tax=Paraburkholderia sp. PGU19 TaxID=2735434 RepID=UPI0015DAD7A7|nr:universal stress protein [Paraburkholderia sp. PGU19]BCG04837.1 universal stress protein A [Paraburkholderia sp. PGU19]